jgi:hypothetical protein
MGRYVLGFQEIDQTQVAVVGGKGARPTSAGPPPGGSSTLCHRTKTVAWLSGISLRGLQQVVMSRAGACRWL